MKYSLILSLVVVFAACKSDQDKADATGTFEADEILVSAEYTGVIKDLQIEEGQMVQSGQFYGYIDSVQLFLKLKQLEAQRKVILSKQPDVAAQLSVLYAQLEQAKREKKRLDALFEGKAATAKQRDDAGSAVAIIENQIRSTESVLKTSVRGLNEELQPIEIQMEQMKDQLSKCRISSPVDGTVLVKYMDKGELISIGKPIYKVASLKQVYLRAYVTGDQFASLKLGQEMQIRVDDGKGNFRKYKGQLTWISDKAEFTPKTIQTKDERANLVYAIKVKTANDGYLKSGMYGELIF
jgi:HlyD family secretion protein